MRLRTLGVGWACVAALGVAVALAAPAVTTGCQTHQCDGQYIGTIPAGAFASGDIVTLDPASGLSLWESNPIDGQWYDFPGETTYSFGWGGFNFIPAGAPIAYVAIDPSPYAADASGQFVVAGGQLAEFSQAGLITAPDGTQWSGGFNVTNATCAHYYLYVSVLGIIPPPPPPAPQDGGNTDAAADAPSDAGDSGDAGTGD